jgi:hypothetical protein
MSTKRRRAQACTSDSSRSIRRQRLMEASMFLDHKAIGVEKDISYLSDIGADIARKLLRTAA